MGRPKLPDEDKTIPQHYRLKVTIVAKATAKAKRLGMKLPAYISQLIVKDCEGG